MISCAAMPKYASAVIIGASCWRCRDSSTARARGSTHRYAAVAPPRNSTIPTENAGMITRRSRWYSAGARNAHVWYTTTGEANSRPNTNASFSVMKNGSVGLVNTSRPSGISGAIGRLRRPMTSKCCTTHHPPSVQMTTASRL